MHPFSLPNLGSSTGKRRPPGPRSRCVNLDPKSWAAEAGSSIDVSTLLRPSVGERSLAFGLDQESLERARAVTVDCDARRRDRSGFAWSQTQKQSDIALLTTAAHCRETSIRGPPLPPQGFGDQDLHDRLRGSGRGASYLWTIPGSGREGCRWRRIWTEGTLSAIAEQKHAKYFRVTSGKKVPGDL